MVPNIIFIERSGLHDPCSQMRCHDLYRSRPSKRPLMFIIPGGKVNRHFTWDACPVYHNVTAAWCVAAAEERAAAAATRRRALAAMHQRPRAMPTIEQRAYQLKVKVYNTQTRLRMCQIER